MGTARSWRTSLGPTQHFTTHGQIQGQEVNARPHHKRTIYPRPPKTGTHPPLPVAALTNASCTVPPRGQALFMPIAVNGGRVFTVRRITWNAPSQRPARLPA